MKNDRAVLVAGAPLRWTRRLAGLAEAAKFLLAADGGADHLARLGLRPSAVIGDLDSISPATRLWLGEDVIVDRPDQNRTDLDKALEYAFNDLDLDFITVLAALGGRVDHEIGNLGLLARFGISERLVYEGAEHRILAVQGSAKLAAEPGETWSFWTFDSNVRVSLEGVRWPLESAPLDAGNNPSISNEATSEEISVETRGGAVIVMRHFGVSQ